MLLQHHARIALRHLQLLLKKKMKRTRRRHEAETREAEKICEHFVARQEKEKTREEEEGGSGRETSAGFDFEEIRLGGVRRRHVQTSSGSTKMPQRHASSAEKGRSKARAASEVLFSLQTTHVDMWRHS